MVRACPICKSRRWHRDASGLIVCSEGHVLANYRNETNEVQETGPHLLRKRSLHKPRRSGEGGGKSNADPKLYHADRARYHYFQCLQLLFRKQVAALIELWGLPKEFEVICRDTWALHLSLLPEIPPEPLHFNSHPQPESSTSSGADKARKPSRPQSSSRRKEVDPRTSQTLVDSEESDASSSADEDAIGEDNQAENANSGDSGSSDSSTEADESDSENSDLAQLLSEASASSDEDEPHTRHDPTTPRPPHGKGRKQARYTTGKEAMGSPRGNLAVIVVALWVLRVPVIYADLVRLVERYELPYLAPLHHLPPEMTLHLNKYTIRLLSPKFAPQPRAIHALASRLARAMWTTYQIRVPELNAAPVLWRAVRGMNGSPLLYTLSKRLLSALDIPLTLHPYLSSTSPSPSESRTNTFDPRKHKYENIPPELALISGVVLALKLLYGLDGVRRLPREEGDPLSGMPEVEEWLGSLRMGREGGRRDWAKLPSDLSVLEMTDQETDDYLDFAHRALVDPRPGIDKPDEELKDRFFPLPLPSPTPARTGGGQRAGEYAYPPYSEFTATPLASEQDTESIRPGSQHTIYSYRDKNGAVPDEYELVLSTAADWARVEMEDVLMIVEVYERRLERNARRERRAAKRRLTRSEADEELLRHQRSRSALRND